MDLGNPGKEYEWSRHNLGFMLIDKLAQRCRDRGWPARVQSLVGRGEIEGAAVKAGEAADLHEPERSSGCMFAGEASSCETPIKQLIVISDDLALPFGKIRIRERGSAGGHNGLKSIIAALGTNEFMRLRIGIQPEHPISDSKRFVLDSFSRSERPVVTKIIGAERGSNTNHSEGWRFESNDGV